MIKTTLPIILALGLTLPAIAQEGGSPSLLLHGNYCGPGNNAPRPPVDALDAACARHDACTPSGGLSTRACNAHLQRDADLIANDPNQPDDLRALAGFVATGAAMLPYAPSVDPAELSALPAVGVTTRQRNAERLFPRSASGIPGIDGLEGE